MTRLRIGLIGMDNHKGEAYKRELFNYPDVEVIVLDLNDELPLLTGDLSAVLFCIEYPFWANLKDMESLIQTCSKHQVPFMPGFPFRCSPVAMAAKTAVERREIGDILAVKASYHSAAHTDNPQHSMLANTVHMVDLISWLAGSIPQEIYTMMADGNGDSYAVDAAFVYVRFDQGVVAVIDTGYSRSSRFFLAEEDIRLELIGTDGVISMDVFAAKNEFYGTHPFQVQWKYYGDDLIKHMIEQFLENIRHGRPLPVSANDGLRAVAAAWAAYTSASLGQPVLIEPIRIKHKGQVSG
ncbi:Gfo/Idh/MocA family protein [Cohnella silvisoli]|uniref:Gfo/Idh/MocA family oxidoreductase n=1 Tax=Cohnella silvisoli TaxID=2873699 RepID=A0ABV1KRN5_9BACL|nr:Gfo/Idh/MocA family oxidoreductase [Cohnella silvisoli]MCD9022434.1 Gfo/Idh/MocA family oxidoreductase [Cohnella silvisoli]